jgi:hypothetical protein
MGVLLYGGLSPYRVAGWGLIFCCNVLNEFIFSELFFEIIFSWDKKLSLGILCICS